MAFPDTVDWSVPPSGFDQIAADLRSMRLAAGEPSFTEIARRIETARAARGVPEHERRVARSTLYDSFRSGRRRMDADTVVEIASALGLPESLRQAWSDRLRAARAAADGASVASASAGVPAPVPSFVGRAAELTTIADALRSEQPVWITGMPGSGKTQLALQAVQASGLAGILVDLRAHRSGTAPVSPAAAQRAILSVLGGDDARSDDDGVRAEQIVRLLRDLGRVLVLDDAVSVEQAEAILGADAAGRIIVTSRALPTGIGERWHQVTATGFAPAEAAALLTRLGGPGEPVADVDAQRLTSACGGLPLAIALVGSRLSTHEGWTLSDHIELMERRISEGRIDSAVRAQLDLSYSALSAPAARLLRACADLPVAELGPATMALLIDSDPKQAAALATELVERNLATVGTDDGITLHSLVRAYALDRAEVTDPPVTRKAAFARLAAHLTDRVWSAVDVISRDQGGSPRPTAYEYPKLPWSAREAADWLHRSLAAILSVAHDAPRRGLPETLFRLSEGLSWWMNLAGHQVAALKLHEAAADLASELGDVDALAMASLDAGQLLVHRDRPGEALAHFARARRLVDGPEGMTDPGLLGVLRNMEALVRIRFGELDEAVDALRSAVELHERLDEGPRLASALTNLSVALHTSGRFEEEAAVLAQGLRHAEETGNDLFRAYFLVNQASLRAKTGDLDGAVEAANETIALSDRIGIPFLTVNATSVLADVARRRGDFERARELVDVAIDQSRTLGSELQIAELLIVAARIAVDDGREDDALTSLAEVDSLVAADGDHVLRGHAWTLRSVLGDDPDRRARARERAIDAYLRGGAEHLAAALRD